MLNIDIDKSRHPLMPKRRTVAKVCVRNPPSRDLFIGDIVAQEAAGIAHTRNSNPGSLEVFQSDPTVEQELIVAHGITRN